MLKNFQYDEPCADCDMLPCQCTVTKEKQRINKYRTKQELPKNFLADLVDAYNKCRRSKSTYQNALWDDCISPTKEEEFIAYDDEGAFNKLLEKLERCDSCNGTLIVKAWDRDEDMPCLICDKQGFERYCEVRRNENI